MTDKVSVIRYARGTLKFSLMNLTPAIRVIQATDHAHVSCFLACQTHDLILVVVSVLVSF